ncbi:MAG: MarR family transcriptional regulator [Verrucomicrobiota bacterium]
MLGIVSARMTQAEYETLAELRFALREFLHFSETQARGAGLTPRQHQALLAIKGFPGPGPISVGELAARLRVRHHSAVELADRLSAGGLLRRAPSARDHRRVGLVLTASGESVLESLSAVHRRELRRVGPRIEAFLRRLRD